MKINVFFKLSTFLLSILLAASCANNEYAAEKGEQQEDFDTTGLTAFAMVERKETTPKSRTTAEYDGSGLNFYWTLGDLIWINDPAAPLASRLKSCSKSNISASLRPNSNTPSAAQRAEKAVFYFAGNYTLPQYSLRYTGGSGSPDKVQIRDMQSQNYPNAFDQMGANGDFGVATAKKKEGRYEFELEHKAAYATFLPYTAQTTIAGFKLQKITIKANEHMAGTYNIDDAGNLSGITNPSSSITMTLSSPGNFSIPQFAANPATNATTMVIAPGTYHNFTVSYKLYNPNNYSTFVLTKTYPSVTFTAGKNKKISQQLKIREYHPEYYLWDALSGRHLWKGYESYQPKNEGESNKAYAPLSSADSRWHNEAAFPMQATQSAQKAPNTNEILWYMQHGDARWDESTAYMVLGKIYTGGVWLKKLSTIAAEHPGKDLHEEAPDGKDRRTDLSGLDNTYLYEHSGSLPTTLPTDLSKYFFLPAFGSYQGRFEEQTTFMYVGTYAQFWTSSSASGTASVGAHLIPVAVAFGFGKTYQFVQRPTIRRIAMPVFRIDNEDVYNPF